MEFLDEQEKKSVEAGLALIRELKRYEYELGKDFKDLIEYHKANVIVTIETAKARDGNWIKYLATKGKKK